VGWSTGTVVAERRNARAHSVTRDLRTPWDALLRRNDYGGADGGPVGVRYVSDLVDVDGILMPRTRRAYHRETPDGPVLDEVMVSIDITDMHFG
jgi:hypothetical protein